MELEELDRFEFGPGSAASFGAWLYGWKYRWQLGAPIRVLVASDYSHCIVLRDANARPPGYLAELQLELELELDDV